MIRRCAIGLVVLGGMVGVAGMVQAEPGSVSLRESAQPGVCTKVEIEMKAEGVSRPGATDRAAKEPRPLALRVETRFVFDERVRSVGGGGQTRQALRHVVQAAAAINGDVLPMASSLRPEVALLQVELRDGAVVSASPGGPLTRAELEVVETPGDPLALPSLLPAKAVSVGDHWAVGTLAARSLSGYEALAANTLEATLESVDEASARVKLSGQIRGAVRGGEGTIRCSGWFTFDRKAARIDELNLTRTETRKPGQVEAGLDIKSTLKVVRRGIETPPELADAAVSALPSSLSPDLELLLYNAPDGKFSLLHDRDWHIFSETVRQIVLKRLDRGELVAQCNLTPGPQAGKGRHQDLGQFRDDIRRALGRRFGRIAGAEEVDGNPNGGFRYRVVVQGHEGEVGVLWYYYLVASPEGEQVLAAFTLGQAQARQFGDQDLRLIGSLEWKAPAGPGPAEPDPNGKPAAGLDRPR